MRRSLTSFGSVSASCAVLALCGVFGSTAAIANDNLISLAKDNNNYVMPARDYTAQNYSPMDQINTGNVKDLRVAWSFSTGLLHGHEGTPLVVIAGEEMTVGDTTIPKGDTMMLLLAAAHRDPSVNDRPDEFDPDREAIRHLAFGRGAHYCLGAPLARLEAAVALSALTARFPHARMDSEPAYKPNVTLRGMSSLSVSV